MAVRRIETAVLYHTTLEYGELRFWILKVLENNEEVDITQSSQPQVT